MSVIFCCRQVARLASESLDRPLGLHERLLLRLHTMMCGACTAYRHQIATIDLAFAQRANQGKPYLPTSEALDTAARERIRDLLRVRVRQLSDKPH